MKFPREVWPGANKQTNAFASKRKLVYNKEQFNEFVQMYNGRMNCFTSVYDYEEYTEKQAITSTVILDRIFLDFDSHHGRPDKATGAIEIKPNGLLESYEDLIGVCDFLIEKDYMFDISFSGRGFHVYVYGESTQNIRRLTAFFNQVKKYAINGTLDSSAVSSRRLRRIRNTMNMKSAYEGGCYYCIPLTIEDLQCDTLAEGIEKILAQAKKPNPISLVTYGSVKVSWPEVAPIEESNVEVDVIKVGNLPIPPCMHSAIMVENPTDEARAFLVSWYKDLLIWMNFNTDFFTMKVIPDAETRANITEQIVEEIRHLRDNHDGVWLDFDESITRYRTKYVVDGNYYFPNCHTLISKAYCIGKCWRLK